MTALKQRFPIYGWFGLALAAAFWVLNWNLEGIRTHWGFFPMWLGYCLTVDALVFWRGGTSLLHRSWRSYIGLFLLSVPVWWIFEAINLRLQNWHYQGVEVFSRLAYLGWASLSFSTVIPAVMGSAELVAGFSWIKRIKNGFVLQTNRTTTLAFFSAGIIMLGAMLTFPKLFFPFAWLSLFFILEPINVWLGNRTLAEHTRRGNWRPVITLWIGVLITAFFWEMWNIKSYPKWIYTIPWGGCCKIFEMPLLGYGGYLPFALELYAFIHFVYRLLGDKSSTYIILEKVKPAG